MVFFKAPISTRFLVFLIYADTYVFKAGNEILYAQSCFFFEGFLHYEKCTFIKISAMSIVSCDKRGGARLGAGRKKGSSVYGESTKAVRVPESLLPTVQALLKRQAKQFEELSQDYPVLLPKFQPSILALPLFVGKVSAGFPSPADDFIEKTLDLNEFLVKNPPATFFTRVQGDSMIGAGIQPNAILVVNRAEEPADGKIVVCALNGELTVKRLVRNGDHWLLKAENPHYPDIPLYAELDVVIWGVVTGFFYNF